MPCLHLVDMFNLVTCHACNTIKIIDSALCMAKFTMPNYEHESPRQNLVLMLFLLQILVIPHWSVSLECVTPITLGVGLLESLPLTSHMVTSPLQVVRILHPPHPHFYQMDGLSTSLLVYWWPC